MNMLSQKKLAQGQGARKKAVIRFSAGGQGDGIDLDSD